ncbi:MFS general substrate transporter [Phlegmacium glaucopus]|nr:MFS general substrate transporter [Phlegmacium glaucopus]
MDGPSDGHVKTETMVDSPKPAQKKPVSFWLSMFSIMIATFLAALDTGAVATALPTIINDLQGEEFVWIGSAYVLAGVAFIPMSGHLANIFGRRPILLIFLFIFALGSALCGAAQNMNMLIGGRTVQGVGSGGILSLTEIILADLVPLSERGAYQGMIGLIWSIASIVGPIIGGAFAQRRDFTWRGLFYLNLPLTGISMLLCLFFLNLKIPHQTFRDKFRRIDWIGNFIVVGSSTAALLGLTWGGIRYPWSSFHVLVPLILGVVGLFAFMVYEVMVPAEPTVPLRIIANRTSISGYIGTGLQGLVISAALFYLPVYFQACKGGSPLRSGIDMFPYSFSVAPFAIVAGGTATAFNRYKPQNVMAWVFITVGMGLQSTLNVDSAVRNWVGFQIVAGIGFGMLFTATTFPILAPLHVRDNASALSLFIFIRSFFQAWGITIGATVLQNQLRSRLPQAFLSSLPQGIEISYAAIPQIEGLAEPLRDQVRTAFADSLDVLWKVMIAIAGVGFISSLVMKEMPLQNITDGTWGLQDGETEKRNAPDETA